MSNLIDNHKKVIGADVVMLSNLALLGDIVQLDDILCYRYVPQNVNGKARVRRHIHQLIGGEEFQVNALMSYVGMLFGYMQVIIESNLPATERQYMYRSVLREAEWIQSILVDELVYLITVGKKELDMLEGFPEIQAYRATQVLDGLYKLRALGFETDEIKSIASRSSKILKKRQRQIQKKMARKVLTFSGAFQGLLRKVYNKIDSHKQIKMADEQ